MYADGDTVGPLALGLMGFFLVWIGVSFSVGFPCGLIVSFLFHLTLSSQAKICIHFDESAVLPHDVHVSRVMQTENTPHV